MQQITKKYNELKLNVEFGNKLSENNETDGDTTEFQKGAVCYRPLMDKSLHAPYMYEDKYENSKRIAVESSFLGFPVSDQITDNHGLSISYFEFGVMVSGIGIPEPIIGRYTFPSIGNPSIVSPARSYEIKNFIRGTFENIKTSVYDHIVLRRPQFFEEIFTSHFFLRAVSSKSPADDVLLVPEIKAETVSSPLTKEREVTVSVSLGPSPSVSLHDKTLFDVAFRFVNEFVLAPHAIFANKNWDNFVIMHVTDIHVSRRIEYAKDDLKKMSAERPDLINEFNIRHFNSFNDNFRDFISYVNSLHKNGAVDCILATGDLVDYVFDSREQSARTPRDPGDIDRVNGNNFDFLKRLILGLEPGKDGTRNEELLVPIFTSLGNHDYRAMPYCWTGEVDPAITTGGIEGGAIGGLIGVMTGGAIGGLIGAAIGGTVEGEIPIPVENIELDNYKSTNLFFSEAKALEGGERPVFSTRNALKMAEVDKNLPQYDTINNRRSYIINLGPHRIVMLDSAHDTGIIDTNWDVFKHKMGWDSGDSKRFAQGSPNSVGVQQEHIDLLKQAITEAGSTGIVIVGIHAPLIDISYYPYYLRETDRFAPNVTVMERGFPYFAPFFSKDEGYRANGQMPGWQLTGSDFFKSGGLDYTLENGVSKGLNKQFLEICTGVGVSRKVDLVLSGHGHKNVEFRLRFGLDNLETGKSLKEIIKARGISFPVSIRTVAQEFGLTLPISVRELISILRHISPEILENLLFFHDYYTENPARYYATKLLPESDFVRFKADFAGKEDEDDKQDTFEDYRDKMVYCLTVINESLKVTKNTRNRDHRFGEPPIVEELAEVPPYPSPLNKTDNKVRWWTIHRPLLLQTTALGPIETINSGIELPRGERLADRGLFHGCRKITIKNNVISSIEVVHMSEIRGPRPLLCSLKELCRVRGISFPASVRSLAEDIKRIPPISERLKKE